MLTELQENFLRQLWAMRKPENLNAIAYAYGLISRGRAEKRLPVQCSTGNYLDSFVSSRAVIELFDIGYLQPSTGGDNYFEFGYVGETWASANGLT